MGSESEVPTIKRVELSDEQWVELRTRRLVSDVRYQREQRHARGDYDDAVLDEMSLIEARTVAWSFMGGTVPDDMALRRKIYDGLDEDDAFKLVLANKGVDEDPKDSGENSPDSSTGTPTNRRMRRTKPTPSERETSPGNG